nr:ribonuclease H-like domain-containing protein [Tanacetum cinerariifolium]
MKDMLPLGEELKEEELLVKDLLKLVLLKVPRRNNMYSVDIKNIVLKEILTCLVANATLNESMLWHMRFGHINFKHINKLVKDNLVRGLPSKCFENDQTYVACLKVKQHKSSCIRKEFSIARTPQQNGVAERRNMTLIEAARTMFADSKLPTTFWAEAVNTTCYVQNRVLVVKPYNKTHYELFRGRTPTLSFIKPFGCHVAILNTLDHLGKFDGKSDDGFFIRISLNSNGPEWLFDIDIITKSMNYVPVIAGTNSNDFAGSPSFGDVRKKHNEVLDKESKASNKLNYAFENISIEYPNDLKCMVWRLLQHMMILKKKLTLLIWSLQSKGNAGRATPVQTIKGLDFGRFAQGIEEEVYVCQPLGFEDLDHPNKVYKVVKALYSLHQAPRACNDKYVAEVLRKFNFSDVKSASTLVDMKKTLVKDADGDDVDVHLYRSMIGSLMYLTASRPDIIDSLFELVAYTDSDYAGESLDRKSTTGGCQFLGSRLISWQCKKQTMVATLTTEVEYVAAASLGDQKDASKQGRIIDDHDADEGVTLVDETQGRNDQDVFDTSIFDDEEVVAEKEVSTADPVPTAGEVVTTTDVEVSTLAITS